ncbi:uncharacterized protein LOC131018498 [Salvia miltiorrhiza]|uniref:uncharacterized protein LOC131018498 n=1 Tax=Salvia miltiorrhiza TaxID=226208 RepID=UPI0025ABE73C|nr:uncharacterized protein LOC131018498 [Salvia miltiorrhiza]
MRQQQHHFHSNTSLHRKRQIDRKIRFTKIYLLVFSSNATTTTATRTSSKIQSLLSQTSDPNLKVVYSFCSNYYTPPLSALSAAKEKLRLRAFHDVKSAANTVFSDAAACRKAFDMRVFF